MKRGTVTARSNTGWLLFVIVYIVLLILPRFIGEYYVNLTIKIYILALLACSFNLLLGYTGLLSFGQAAYFAVGAYSCALFLKLVTPDILLALPFGLLFSGAVALFFGYFCVRLSEIYFAMLTLAFGQIVYTIAFKWESLTGGDNGLAGIPSPPIKLGIAIVDLSNVFHYYYFALFLISASIGIIYLIVNSPFGATLKAIRENPERASFMGQNVRKFQLISFVIAGTFCGLAGAIFAPFEKFVSPELTHWSKSAEIVLVSILGGIYTFIGPVVGAAVMILLEDYISTYTSYWAVFLGTVLIIIVIFMPEGIVGRINRTFSKLKAKTLMARSE
jgi:branched-chain amino acid transport system permease protein